MKRIDPLANRSLDYGIRTWYPDHRGGLFEPHHNTYDIEFWGPDGMTTSFYLGALEAMIKMSSYLNEDEAMYSQLFARGKAFVEQQLYNGSYFIQKIQWT